MSQHHAPDFSHLFSARRDFLPRCGMGLGALALHHPQYSALRAAVRSLAEAAREAGLDF
jgi:hypothetical protein